jgi:hypothetical protein
MQISNGLRWVIRSTTPRPVSLVVRRLSASVALEGSIWISYIDSFNWCTRGYALFHYSLDKELKWFNQADM